MKVRQIGKLLDCPVGYDNGHLHEDETGRYAMDCYPIPEVTVRELCDIAIGLDEITLTRAPSREQALVYHCAGIARYQFDAYGVVDYLEDFYADGTAIDALLEKQRNSREKNDFFSFRFGFDIPVDHIREFIGLLREVGFFD